MKTFVTFGQAHVHVINGVIFDKDCVAIVNGDRAKVFKLFGTKFCFEYPEEHWVSDGPMAQARRMKYFPRGYIEVEE